MAGELFSARAVLRPFAEVDAPELHALFRDPAVRRYLLDDALVPAEWVTEEIESSSKRFAATGAGLWSVRLSGEDRIVGFVGFREFFDPPQLQLLYGLLPEYWGRGLATEVASLICAEAFCSLGFAQVAAATDRPNFASSRVLERLGMELVLSSSDGVSGTLFYLLKREQWERQRLANTGI